MTRLIAQILTGARRGRRESFARTPIAFGRSAECDLILDIPQISRKHGMIVYEDDRWVVVNESPNGTTVNGRKVGARPRPLVHGDVIGVGRDPLFAVGFEQTGEDEQADEQPGEAVAADSQADHMKRRSKLWMGIGIYAGLILVILAVLSQVMDKGNGGGPNFPTMLKPQQIETALTAPLELSTNDRLAAESLNRARSLYNQIARSDETLFDCYMAFKQALAYADKTSFEGADQLQFTDAKEKTVKMVIEQYRDAYALTQSEKWTRAEAALRHMVVNFELPKTISDNVNQLLRIVTSKSGG